MSAGEGIDAAFHGVLGRDAEIKVSNAGNNCVRLNVRVGSGDAAQWVQVLAFNDLDELAALTKGDKVYCEGTLTASAWIDNRSGTPTAKPSQPSSPTRSASASSASAASRSRRRYRHER
jgi:hypothetical protein